MKGHVYQMYRQLVFFQTQVTETAAPASVIPVSPKVYNGHVMFLSQAVGAKAPRKLAAGSGGASSSSKTPSKKSGCTSNGGGNPMRLCDIPAWQKGL